jgi:GDP-D-mannose 3', 5'-epimerase
LKRPLVCCGGAYIAGHLVKKLKRDGRWVRGVDIKEHESCPTAANEFRLVDVREKRNCQSALSLPDGVFDEVHQLGADTRGMEFIHSAECEIMRNSALISLHLTRAAAKAGIPRYFSSCSVCVYRNMHSGETKMSEEDVIPAHPDSEYDRE